MSRTRDPKLLAAEAAQREDKRWRGLLLEARRRDLTLTRTEPEDGALRFITTRRGRTEVHATEADLRLFMRGCH